MSSPTYSILGCSHRSPSSPRRVLRLGGVAIRPFRQAEVDAAFLREHRQALVELEQRGAVQVLYRGAPLDWASLAAQEPAEKTTESDGLEKLTKKELLAVFADRDITPPKSASNAELIALLREAD